MNKMIVTYETVIDYRNRRCRFLYFFGHFRLETEMMLPKRKKAMYNK